MGEFCMTGYLKSAFANETHRGRVMNFFLKSDGYSDKDGGFVNEEHAFETWLPGLIDKIANIPRESLITVYFTIHPKKVPLPDNKKGQYSILKANRVTNWRPVKKEEKKESDDEMAIQMEFGEIPPQ